MRSKGDRLENFVAKLGYSKGSGQKTEGILFDKNFDIDVIGTGIVYNLCGHICREEDVGLKIVYKNILGEIKKIKTILVQCANYSKHPPSNKMHSDPTNLFGAIHAFQSLDERIKALDAEEEDREILEDIGVEVLDSATFDKKYTERQRLGPVTISYRELNGEPKKKRISFYMGELNLVKEKRIGKDKEALLNIIDFNERKIRRMGASGIAGNIKTGREFYSEDEINSYWFVVSEGNLESPSNIHVEERINGSVITDDALAEAFYNKQMGELLKPVESNYFFAGAAIDAAASHILEMLTKKLGRRGDKLYSEIAKRVLKKDFTF